MTSRSLLCLILLMAACVPVPDAPTATPARDTLQQQPTEPPPPYQEPAIPVTAANATDVQPLGRLDPPATDVGSVYSYAFAIDSTRLAVLTQDLLIGWDLLNGQVVFFTNRLGARQVYYAVDKTEVYTLDGDGFVRVIDGESGNQIATFTAQPNFDGHAAYDPNTGYLAVTSQDGQVSVWDPLERDLLVRFSTEDARINDIAFSGDGAIIVIGTGGGAVELWDWQARRLIDQLTTGEAALPVGRVAVGPRLAQIAAGTTEDVRLWNVQAQLVEHILLTGENGTADLLVYTPDGSYVINSGLAEAMNIWDPASGELVAALPELGGDRTAAAFDPSGSLLLATVFQGGTYLYNLAELGADGIQRAELEPPATIVDVGWSPDGRTLALFDTRGSAFIYGIPAPSEPSDQ